jgi:hypothetical protein
MSRLDVMKSLLRSAAVGASERLDRLGVGTTLRKTIAELAARRLFIPDARLTAAVARVPDVLAATVSTRDGRVRIDATFRDGGPLLASLVPDRVMFAAHGAKEWSVLVEPNAAALDPRTADVFAALASEVVACFWGPLLPKSTTRGKTAFAHRDGDTLVMDLRTLPEVRAALSRRLSATAIDALALQAIVAEDGGLRLVPALAGVPL